MIVLNVIAWIFLIISILVYAVGTVTEKTVNRRVAEFVFMLGYICTLIAYINK